MERKVIWTILIGIILFVATFFICIDRLPQSSHSTTSQPSMQPTPTPQIVYVTVLVTPTPTSTAMSSTGGDQAAIAKMLSMGDWMVPTMDVIGESLGDGDFLKAGLNAVLLRVYIDKNLPEMRQLANGATTKKAAALEFVAYLEDMRSASDKIVQAADKYNSGDITNSVSILESGTVDINRAKAHLKQATALL